MSKTRAMTAERPWLRARLLGPAEIAVNGRLLTGRDWPGRRARDLLLILLASRGHQIHREQAMDLLWPDADLDAAANALYKALHALRRTLEPTLRGRGTSRFIHTTGDTIAIAPDADLLLDTDQFAELVRRGTADGPTDRSSLRDALTLMRGEFIADDPYAEWLVAQREGYRGEWQRLTLHLAHLDLEAGDPLRAIPTLEAWLAQAPYDEQVHQAVMRAFAAAGQRNAALQHLERCREQVRRDLDDDLSPETLALAAEIRQAPVTATPINHVDPNATRYRSIPALPTPTVGRGHDLDVITRLLETPSERLLTLLGTGGIGKTRLATVAANQVRGAFPDGIVFVPLAAIRDVGLLYSTIGAVLDLPDNSTISWRERVIGALQTGRRLLVLDNLEQLPDVGPEVADLLEACPDLTVLATSRVPLRIRAERLYRLDPLAVPTGPLDRSALERAAASQLFLQTIDRQEYRPHQAQDLGAIATICERLDGLPLAIELAAARCFDLSPAEVLTQLDERSCVVTLRDGPTDLPTRHQTLTDLVRWSYDLLDEPEQRLFRTLAVFSGGVEPDALAALGGPDAEARANLLADHHLVQWVQVGGTRRLRMLETIREVAAMLLESSAEATALHHNHTLFYADLISNAYPQLHGEARLGWFDRYERDLDNIRQALAWSQQNHPTALLTIASYAWPFWFYRSHTREGLGWLERVLPLPDTNLSEAHAIAAQAFANLYERTGEHEKVIEFETIAQQYWEHHGDPLKIAMMNRLISSRKYREGDLEEVVLLNSEALEISRAHDDAWGLTHALVALASVQMHRSQLVEAIASLNEALDVARTSQDILAQSYVLPHLGAATYHSGDIAGTLLIGKECERLARLVNNRMSLPWALLIQMGAAYDVGQYAEGLVLAREAVTLFDEVGDRRNAASARQTYGMLEVDLANLPSAARQLGEALHVLRDVGFIDDKASCLFEIGRLAAARNQHHEAIVLLAANQSIREAVDLARTPGEQERFGQELSRSRSLLNPNAADAAWHEGLALSLEEALDYGAGLCAEPTANDMAMAM